MQNSTDYNYINVGTQISKAREMLGKTVAQFADRLRISKNTLTNYEYGYTKIPFDVIRKCHEICNLPYEYFAEGKEMSDYELYQKLKNLSPKNQALISQLIDAISKN